MFQIDNRLITVSAAQYKINVQLYIIQINEIQTAPNSGDFGWAQPFVHWGVSTDV